MVNGALAGEVELSVPYLFTKGRMLGSARRSRDRREQSPMYVVRMRWWGDDGPGTVLKPDVLSSRDQLENARSQRGLLSSATLTLFPVRCGLEGLVAYVKDMVSRVRRSGL